MGDVQVERSKVFPDLLHRRMLGEYVSPSQYYNRLYKGLAKVCSWNPVPHDGGHGAVFNVEFSPDGKLLAAACERLDVVLLDPLTHRKIGKIENAHLDCVNCVRFLDTRTFATCSDDCTVALWDNRNLKSKVFHLFGHSGWVKSIEYNRETKQLLTSAFDHTVRVWNINSYSRDGNVQGQVVCRVLNLTRSKLTPDCKKLVISTTAGAILVVSNLDLLELKENGFLSTSYSFPSTVEACSSTIQKKRKNRMDVLKHFPQNVDPGCVYSLDVHPYSWCIVSRYTSKCGKYESTAVHDIQDFTVQGEEKYGTQQRLTHYIEEPSVARGYIKEICFNEDGRLVCSPFGNGVRVLGFSQNCGELCDNVSSIPAKLVEVNSLFGHRQTVVTCRFSPNQPLLATGCLGGKICFYQPKF